MCTLWERPYRIQGNDSLESRYFKKIRKLWRTPTPEKSEDSVRKSGGSANTEISANPELKESGDPKIQGFNESGDWIEFGDWRTRGLYEIRGLKIFRGSQKICRFQRIQAFFKESFSRISWHFQRLPDCEDCWETISKTQILWNSVTYCIGSDVTGALLAFTPLGHVRINSRTMGIPEMQESNWKLKETSLRIRIRDGKKIQIRDLH